MSSSILFISVSFSIVSLSMPGSMLPLSASTPICLCSSTAVNLTFQSTKEDSCIEHISRVSDHRSVRVVVCLIWESTREDINYCMRQVLRVACVIQLVTFNYLPSELLPWWQCMATPLSCRRRVDWKMVKWPRGCERHVLYVSTIIVVDAGSFHYACNREWLHKSARVVDATVVLHPISPVVDVQCMCCDAITDAALGGSNRTAHGTSHMPIVTCCVFVRRCHCACASYRLFLWTDAGGVGFNLRRKRRNTADCVIETIAPSLRSSIINAPTSGREATRRTGDRTRRYR